MKKGGAARHRLFLYTPSVYPDLGPIFLKNLLQNMLTGLPKLLLNSC